MSSNTSFRETQTPLAQHDSSVWGRLRSEREMVCELLNQSWLGKGTLEDLRAIGIVDPLVPDQRHHRELLHQRLRQVDDALDRLMSGSYGNCSKCGRWIEDDRLAADPSLAFCIDCQRRAEGQPEIPVVRGDRFHH